MADMNDIERYLLKAQESLQGAESELTAGRLNNVANRGYYAAFQAAVAALIDAGIPVQRDTDSLISHRGVHSQFNGILISRRKVYPASLRSVLQKLLEERIVADYRSVGLSQSRAASVVRQARNFVASITSRLQSEEKTG
jgi:uncharacterized protein (UPF0332 family)